MIVAGLAYGFWVAGWIFFAYGPQFVLCMLFGYLGAKRSGGDLITWMAVSFLWSLLPIAGVFVTWWRWHRTGQPAKPGGHGEQPQTTP